MYTGSYNVNEHHVTGYFTMFQSTRKSALLTAAKKAKLKNNPSRVRFAEAVIVNGAPVTNVSTDAFLRSSQ